MTSRSQGLVLAVGAATLWGVSGNFAQFLFQHRGVDSSWMVTVRLLLAGLLLLIMARFRGFGVFAIWRGAAAPYSGGIPESAGLHARDVKETSRRLIDSDAVQIVLFGIFGMLGVQLTYFEAIRTSNAATATVLQYLGPVFIAIWSAWSDKRVPKPVEFLAIGLAVGGTVLLVTHGDISRLAITREALTWGLLSALALALYSLQPQSLLKRYDSSLVVGWGMLIGGVAMSFIQPPWHFSGDWDFAAFVSAAFIVVFGSLAAFYAYLSAVAKVGASTASLLACAEPLSAMLVAVLWLHVPLTPADWLGTALIISTILILTWREREAA